MESGRFHSTWGFAWEWAVWLFPRGSERAGKQVLRPQPGRARLAGPKPNNAFPRLRALLGGSACGVGARLLGTRSGLAKAEKTEWGVCVCVCGIWGGGCR